MVLNFAWVTYDCWTSTAAQPSPPISPLLAASGLHEPKWFDSTSLDHSTFALTSALCVVQAQWLHTIQIFSALHRLAYLRPPCTSQSPAAVGPPWGRPALLHRPSQLQQSDEATLPTMRTSAIHVSHLQPTSDAFKTSRGQPILVYHFLTVTVIQSAVSLPLPFSFNQYSVLLQLHQRMGSGVQSIFHVLLVQLWLYDDTNYKYIYMGKATCTCNPTDESLNNI